MMWGSFNLVHVRDGALRAACSGIDDRLRREGATPKQAPIDLDLYGLVFPVPDNNVKLLPSIWNFRRVLGILLVEGLHPMDEREAVRRLQEGDIGGLSALVSLHQKKAVQCAYLITGDPALAEDVVQAAFVRAYERIGQFDDGRPFASWFVRIVINDAIKAAQRRSREVSLETGEPSLADLLSDGNPGPAAQMEEADFRFAVRKALRRLAPRQRAAIVMRYFLEMTEDEIAAAMHSPPGTVKSRLHRARERLRALLRPLPGGR